MLLAEGVATDIGDSHSRTPIDIAVGEDNGDVVAILAAVETDAGKERWPRLMCRAARYGRTNAARALIDAGAQIGSSETDESPIFTAIEWDHREVVVLLLARGVDVNGRGALDLTPLHYAAGFGRKEIMEMLLARGADVNAVWNGKTPMDMIQSLLIHRDPGPDTPEPSCSFKEAVELLARHGGREGRGLPKAPTEAKPLPETGN